MSIESSKNSIDSEPREKIDAFLKSFDGLTLRNSAGKSIEIKLEKKETIKTSGEDHSEGCLITFEGFNAQQKDGNYLSMIIEPDEKYIEIGLVRLTDKELKGRNIYPQLINYIGANFPEGFTLRATVEHDKTRDKAMKLFDQFAEGSITEDELKGEIMKSGMLKLTNDAGFNDINVVLEEGDIQIWANKNKESEAITLSTEIKDPEDSELSS